MSIIVVARGLGEGEAGVDSPGGEGEIGRWPLAHGVDPVDLLAQHGLIGRVDHASRGDEGQIEIHYVVTERIAAAAPAVPASRVAAQRVQRVGAYGLVSHDGRLLMAQLAQRVRSGAGLWTLPGGGVDPGEEPVVAVVREVHEETGQQVVVGELIQVQSRLWQQPARGTQPSEDMHAVGLIYRADCPQPSAAHVVEVDGSTGQAAWVPLDAVPEVGIVPSVERALPLL